MKILLYLILLTFTFVHSYEVKSQNSEKKDKTFFSYNNPAQKYSIEDFKGKFILLDFWGLGCKPCLMAIPEMVKIQEKYSDKLVIIGINDRIREEELGDYVKKEKINYPIVHCEDFMGIYKFFSKNEFYGFPYYVLLDKEGKVISNKYHYTKLVDLLNKI